MATAYLALGSNLGDRLENLRTALKALPPFVEVRTVSPVYETAPLYVAEQPRFLNAAASVVTSLTPDALLTHVKQIEKDVGRTNTHENGPRTIDLDILLYDDTIMQTPGLTIPHARMHERAFVLAPLHDIAPQVTHPVLRQTVRELYAALPSQDIVKTDLTL